MKTAKDSVLRYRGLWLLIGYALLGLIVYLSVTSHPVRINVEFPFQDKLMHALAYFVLMGWFAQLYHARTKCLYHAVVFILVGVVMEYVQSFDPARMAETADMAANTFGVVLAALLAQTTSFRYLLANFEALIRKP